MVYYKIMCSSNFENRKVLITVWQDPEVDCLIFQSLFSDLKGKNKLTHIL